MRKKLFNNKYEDKESLIWVNLRQAKDTCSVQLLVFCYPNVQMRVPLIVIEMLFIGHRKSRSSLFRYKPRDKCTRITIWWFWNACQSFSSFAVDLVLPAPHLSRNKEVSVSKAYIYMCWTWYSTILAWLCQHLFPTTCWLCICDHVTTSMNQETFDKKELLSWKQDGWKDRTDGRNYRLKYTVIINHFLIVILINYTWDKLLLRDGLIPTQIKTKW